MVLRGAALCSKHFRASYWRNVKFHGLRVNKDDLKYYQIMIFSSETSTLRRDTEHTVQFIPDTILLDCREYPSEYASPPLTTVDTNSSLI